MTKAAVKHLSVSLTVSFLEVVPLCESNLDKISKSLLQRFSGYGLRHLDFFRRQGDGLFDYDLTCSLLNRNVTFRFHAEGVHMSLQNARDQKDAGIISDCLIGAFETLSDRRIRESRLEAFIHVSLNSLKEREQFLASLGPSNPKSLVRGVILYSPAAEPFAEVRLLADRSNALEDGVFLNWTTQFIQPLTQDLLNHAASSFRNLALEIGMEL